MSRRTKLMSVSFLSCLAVFSGLNRAQDLQGSEADATWRDLDHGGFNALYFLLRIYGTTRTYDECLKDLGDSPLPQSLADIVSAASRLSMQLQALFVTPEQLASARLPLLTHVAGDDVTAGYFCVLLQVQKERIVYLDGPSGTICSVEKEPFLRRWSGAILVPKTRHAWIDSGQFIVGGILGFSAIYVIRKRFSNISVRG